MKSGAIILAGGFGTRLRPLTEFFSKPLAPVLAKSAYEHILDLLAKHGINNAVAAVAYKAEQIMAIKHDKVSVSFFTEDKPLGTAGCVKNASDALDECFVVISGDAVCDFDLTAAIEYHKKSGAEATILLSRVTSPLEYGGVMTENGYVLRFVEKPSRRQALTDTVSTGVYIIQKTLLERVPVGEQYDFAKDIFHNMQKNGEKIAAFVCEGYWCDIGDLGAYYRCNFDALSGKIKLNGAQSTISNDFQGENATVTKSIIHKNVLVGGGTTIDESIICEGARIGRGCVIPAGCVVGAFSVLGDGVVLSPGTIIGVNKKIRTGSSMFYSGEDGSISEGRLSGKSATIDCAFCLKLGRAFGLVFGKNAPVGISFGSHAALLAEAFSCGIRESGAHCVSCGEGTVGQASAAVLSAGLGGTAHIVTSGENVFISLFDSLGLPPERSVERKLTAEFLDRKPPKPSGKQTFFDSEISYYTLLIRLCGDLSKLSLVVSSRTPPFFAKLLAACDAKVEVTEEKDGIDIIEDISGHSKPMFYKLDFWHSVAVAAAIFQKNELKKFALPYVSPDSVADYIRSLPAEVLFYSPSPSDSSDAEARELASKQPWMRDGFMLCAVLCSASAKLGVKPENLADILSNSLREFHTAERELEYDSEKIAALMRELCDKRAAPQNDGARLELDKGSVIIVPSDTGFRLFAQSVSAEAADELCADAERLIFQVDS